MIASSEMRVLAPSSADEADKPPEVRLRGP
jgi:hypothetical protein